MLRDLIAAETLLRKVAGTRGGEYAGPCPWCGGRDRFRVWPEADEPGYWYRQCGKHGDAIQYLRDRHGLSYPEACERLNVPTTQRTSWPMSPPAAPEPPSATWQNRARVILEAAKRRLCEPMGEKARDYLRHRGFTQATIKHARLGYHPCEVRDAPQRWGFAANRKPIWLPRGIVIPVRQGNHVWMLWVRRPAGEPKYVAVAGSHHADCGIEAVRFGHPAVLVEGIFDGLAMQEAAGDLVAPVVVGTRHGTPQTIGRLALAKPLLLALDADEAGDAAATWWHRIFPQATRWRPTQKDPAAMLQAGQDIRGWIEQGLGIR